MYINRHMAVPCLGYLAFNNKKSGRQPGGNDIREFFIEVFSGLFAGQGVTAGGAEDEGKEGCNAHWQQVRQQGGRESEGQERKWLAPPGHRGLRSIPGTFSGRAEALVMDLAGSKLLIGTK